MSSAIVSRQPQMQSLSWRSARLSAGALRALGIAAMVAFGSLAFYPLWHRLSELWSTDPLRSIGAAFPLISFVGVLSAWRRLDWRQEGNWWGLPVVALALPLARVAEGTIFELIVRGHHLGLVHPGMVFLVYGAGATLLFGGWPLLRASLVPLLLLLAVNPVPFAYNALVDLPLQELSANTARGFAHLIGLHPTGEQLRMMFAPDFGMLIVPGCNGVRGSVTFAYLALIFGYSRGLRPRTLAWVTASAFVLGYALNLLRLSVLVLYYRLGLSFPVIQDYGVGVDYCIGCTIFLLATLSLGLLIRSLEPPALIRPRLPAAPMPRARLRVACFVLVVSLFLVPQLRVLASPREPRPDAVAAMRALPATVGDYRLTRSYFEQFGNGVPALVLGDYTGGDGSHLTLSLYVAGPTHTLALSRMTQGAQLLQSGSLKARARGGQPMQLATSFYDDGIAREFDAEASCSATSCADHVAGSATSPIMFQAPAFKDLLTVAQGKRLPLYVQREWPDSDPAPTDALRSRFEADTRRFVSQLDLTPIVAQVGSRP